MPADAGCVISNVGTACAISDAFRLGMPLIERSLTISGGAVEKPVNIRVPVGTIVSDLMPEVFQLKENAAVKIISGGPMMGFAMASADFPVAKGTSGVTFLTEKETFLEEEGRERFLTYIAPIINGTGTYSIEEQTRTRLRMDVVIHYWGKEYIVELKIWRGPRYNEEGEKQIKEYLDHFDINTGYLVSFCFNKKKESGKVKRVPIGDKTVFEVIV